MAKAVYVIKGKKSDDTEYPTEATAVTAMKEEMVALGEVNSVGKVYTLSYATTYVGEFSDLPVVAEEKRRRK